MAPTSLLAACQEAIDALTLPGPASMQKRVALGILNRAVTAETTPARERNDRTWNLSYEKDAAFPDLIYLYHTNAHGVRERIGVIGPHLDGVEDLARFICQAPDLAAALRSAPEAARE